MSAKPEPSKTTPEPLPLAAPTEQPTPVGPMSKTERLFCGFCWITAVAKSLAHGGNDVANSVGPFGAVLAAEDGTLEKKSSVAVGLQFFFVENPGGTHSCA